MKLFVTVIVGLGGSEGSARHARLTARALSDLDPDYVGALSLMLVPGTELDAAMQEGSFECISREQTLRELRTMIEQTTMTGLFYANHASNYLPLRVCLPRHKATALELIDEALRGAVRLRPEWSRGL